MYPSTALETLNEQILDITTALNVGIKYLYTGRYMPEDNPEDGVYETLDGTQRILDRITEQLTMGRGNQLNAELNALYRHIHSLYTEYLTALRHSDLHHEGKYLVSSYLLERM